MNLNEIISDATAILGLGTDSNSGSVYLREFTRFANDAIFLISRRFRQARTEKVPIDAEHCFRLSDLDRVCFKIRRVWADGGKDVMWDQPDGASGDVWCFFPEGTAPERVNVTYEFRPAKLVNLDDVPELPEFAHDLIPHYIAAQHFFGQNGKTSKSVNTEEMTFERMLNELALDHYGEPKAYKLNGYNERLL